METSHHSTLQRAAVASGLLTDAQVALAVGAVLAADKTKSADELDDGRLGQHLVEAGLLNRWQVEQLREGRTKFTLGPYRVLDSIGKGGMGHVFKGEHAMLGRVEAIKVLPKERTTPKAIEAFEREVRSQAQLDHPNLVRVSYADRDGETFYFVTEYVPGADLRKLVRNYGRLTMPEAATIVSQAAQAVAYAHSRGLVHRDIKPGNLLVTPEGRTKVTDLGLAWHVEDDDGSDTRTGRIAGTADYLAPEVIRAPDSVGPASDIYALGCTLYYAVTGKVPFPGGRTADKLRRHLEEVPINPRRFNPDLSDMFLDVLADMLEKDPARRIHTADAVVEALRPWTLSSVAVGTTHKPVVESLASEPSGEPAVEPSGFEDTASDLDFADSPSQSSEAPSQTSQGTLRMASWREETVPFDDELEAELPGGQFTDLPDRLPQSLLLVITAAVTVVIVVVLLMIFS